MSDLQVIQSTLEQTARRRRLERGLRLMWQGVLFGAGAWVLVFGIYKLAPLPDGLALQSWLLVPAGAAMGFVWGWLRQPSLAETARWVDGRRQLQERLSTALEVARQEGSEWKNLVLADAAKSVGKLQARDLMPFHLPTASRWALLLLVLGVGLGFVPEYRSKEFVQKKTDEAIIKETGRELANLTKRSLATRPPAMETTRKALEQISELGDHMNKAQLTRGEALKDLSSLTEKLKEQAREMTKDPAVRNLERAARNASSKSGAPSSDLQQKLEAMAQKMAASANPDAMEKMKEDLQKAKDMAANMPKGDTPEAKEARDKMNAALSDLAKQAKNLGLDLPSLSEAIASLQNMTPDQVLKDLQVAEIELEKMEAMAKAIEKMQLDAQKLGKDLAEQLKQGQAEAAQSTLQKMSEALKNSAMTPEEMQKVMEEVSKAMETAKQYGEVGEKMSEAMKQMQQGQKGEASQSLAQAADALGKMMSDLGDAQSLIASMEALQEASMAIANGMAFGQGMNQNGRPGAGQRSGQTTRSGVGTWTDENSWEYPEYSDKWDNTGVDRPDQDGRGIADRGDGSLADNLAATKIKGQITPGGPMPSITMKGVSIKGTSKVQFEEISAAAQSEAQSALNQDQVPRAYQNAVRSYFDDLKE
jgi:hypothetical protein